MDHLAPLSRELSVRAANHAEGERLRKAKEDKRKKSSRSYRRGSEGRTPTVTMMMMMETMMR